MRIARLKVLPSDYWLREVMMLAPYRPSRLLALFQIAVLAILGTEGVRNATAAHLDYCQFTLPSIVQKETNVSETVSHCWSSFHL
jgi:hypothetical protein